jgi:uncharacterized protein
MLYLISPAKSFAHKQPAVKISDSRPQFADDSVHLVSHLQKLSAADLEKLMKISPKLAALNAQRFAQFSADFTPKNSHPALFAFDGDVYKSMTVQSYGEDDLNFANDHLRILSGLYGVLKPLDLMQEYRLEMGTKTGKILGQTLYAFWQEKISQYLNEELKNQSWQGQEEKTLINLASEEYFGAVNTQKINAKIINIIFKEKKGDGYKIIGIHAKRARGLMADFAIKNKITKAADLQDFDLGNYRFNDEMSDGLDWVFCR